MTSGASVLASGDAARLLRRYGLLSSAVLTFESTDPPGAGDSLVAMRTAVEAANATSAPEVLVGGAVASGVAGPVVVVSWSGEKKAAVQPWLDRLVEALGEAGQAGTVRPARRREFDPDKRLPMPRRLVPTALAGFRLTDLPALATPTVTRFGTTLGNAFATTAAHLAAWGAELTDAPRNIRVSMAGPTTLTDRDLSGWLTAIAPLVNNFSMVQYFHPRLRALRQIYLNPHGELVVQEAHPARAWPELLDQARGLLLVDPAALDVGQVRNALANRVAGWNNLEDYTPPPEPGRSWYSFSRHLWHERVTDAAGVSLLTGVHLAHAAHLDRWTVDQVATDRYLVQADDLEPWYATDTTDPRVLARARRDFGDMILTDAHARATPGPYTRAKLLGTGPAAPV